MTFKALIKILQALEKLRSYQPRPPIVNSIVDRFTQLIDHLPASESMALGEALMKFTEKNTENKDSKESTIDKPLPALRRILIDIMENKTQGSANSSQSYPKDFCDIVFDMQVALAMAFPCNEKVEYELLIQSQTEQKEKNPHALPETAILLKKETEGISAIVPVSPGQNDLEKKEEKQSIKKIPLFLASEEQKFIFEFKKESITRSDHPELVDKITLRCGYTIKENLFKDDIYLNEFTLEDDNIVFMSDGRAYSRLSLNRYYKTNNAYERYTFKPCRPNDRGLLSLREQASLRRQGFIFPELNADRKETLLRATRLGGGINIDDREVDFTETNLQAEYGPWPFLNNIENHRQLRAYWVGVTVGLALYTSLVIVVTMHLPIALFIPVIKIFPFSIGVAAIISLVELCKKNDPFFAFLDISALSNVAIFFPQLLGVVLCAFPFLAPIVPAALMVLGEIIQLAPVALLLASVVNSLFKDQSLIDFYKNGFNLIKEGLNQIFGFFGLIAVETVKLVESVHRCISSRRAPVPSPVVDTDMTLAPNAAQIQSRLGLRRSQSMSSLPVQTQCRLDSLPRNSEAKSLPPQNLSLKTYTHSLSLPLLYRPRRKSEPALSFSGPVQTAPNFKHTCL